MFSYPFNMTEEKTYMKMKEFMYYKVSLVYRVLVKELSVEDDMSTRPI